MTPNIRCRSLIQIGLQIPRWRTKRRQCKCMAVSQAFIFHIKWYSLLHSAVCQLLCWTFLLLLPPMLSIMLMRNHVTLFLGYISAASVGWRAVEARVESELELEYSNSAWVRERERVLSLAGLLLVAAGRLASFGAFGPRSSDLVNRTDRTTSGSPAAMGEWRSGSRWGSVHSTGGRLGPTLCHIFYLF